MTEIIHDIGLDPGFYDGETHSVTSTITEGGSGLVPTNLWITIRDEATGSIVGGRDRSSLTPVTTYIDPQGVLTYNFLVTEVSLLSTLTEKISEVHRVTFEFNWLATTRVGFIIANYTVNPITKQLD